MVEGCCAESSEDKDDRPRVVLIMGKHIVGPLYSSIDSVLAIGVNLSPSCNCSPGRILKHYRHNVFGTFLNPYGVSAVNFNILLFRIRMHNGWLEPATGRALG